MESKEHRALQECILAVWDDPDVCLDGCVATVSMSEFDRPDILKWVRGIPFSKENIRLLAASDATEVEMPLYSVGEEFLDYFIGIYMVNLTETLELWADAPFFDFSVLHFAGFLASDRFPPAFARLSAPKKWLLFAFLSSFLPALSNNAAFCSLFSGEEVRRLKELSADLLRQEASLLEEANSESGG